MRGICVGLQPFRTFLATSPSLKGGGHIPREFFKYMKNQLRIAGCKTTDSGNPNMGGRRQKCSFIGSDIKTTKKSGSYNVDANWYLKGDSAGFRVGGVSVYHKC